ncbi:hypothetical protein TNCV_4122971 [Trichonephila clavipes]|nr:hypothetical protein TNCV_4122971 [Trichonephila clavipes]
MATGSFTSHNYSSSQSEVPRDHYRFPHTCNQSGDQQQNEIRNARSQNTKMLEIVRVVCSQLASVDKNNALQEIKLRFSYLQGKSTTMSVIAHQTEKEWISANKKSRQRMSQTQTEGAAKQHAARLEEAHLQAHHSCFTSERC